jgi:hypothetical protein
MQKTKLIVSILVLSFSFFASQSVTFAAWYNPFTWFQPEQKVEIPTPHEEQGAAAITAVTPPVPEPERIIEYVEKPVIKEVVKTVTQTVEDPVVRQQLNDALAKNTQLTSQIQQYQNLVEQYKAANQQLNSKYADAVGVAAQCVAQLKSQSSYAPTPTVRCTSNTSTINGTTFTICN